MFLEICKSFGLLPKCLVSNEIRSTTENSPFSKVGRVPNESEIVATFRGNRLEGKFVRKNVINFSKRDLS